MIHFYMCLEFFPQTLELPPSSLLFVFVLLPYLQSSGKGMTKCRQSGALPAAASHKAATRGPFGFQSWHMALEGVTGGLVFILNRVLILWLLAGIDKCQK